MTTRITKATIKSFIKKNQENLFLLTKSSYDGMVDGLSYNTESTFNKVTIEENANSKYTMGIKGAWFVGQSRDYFDAFENDNFIGYKVYNSCGSFYLAINK